jgi:hypothetical protein
MKCRLKSRSASHGVCPMPVAPVRSFCPIKASQMSPNIPIRGRRRAAGLRGWFSRNSSTSCFIISGSSSIASEVTSLETCMGHILAFEPAKRISLLCNESDAVKHRTPKALRAKSIGSTDSISRSFWSARRVPRHFGSSKRLPEANCYCEINRGPKSSRPKS